MLHPQTDTHRVSWRPTDAEFPVRHHHFSMWNFKIKHVKGIHMPWMATGKFKSSAVNYLDLWDPLSIFLSDGGTFDFRSYTTHHTFTAREASSAYLQAWGISGTVWLPLRTIISWWINVNYNTVIIGIHGIRIYHILMPQHGSASSNNKVCDFRKPLALADGLKLELATPACHMHALRQAMSNDVKLQGVFLTHHDKGW